MKKLITVLTTSTAFVAAFVVMQPVDAGYTHPTTTHPVYTTTTTVPDTTTTSVVINTVVAPTTTTVAETTTTAEVTTSTVPQTTTSASIETTSTSSLPPSTTTTTESATTTTSSTLPATSSTTSTSTTTSTSSTTTSPTSSTIVTTSTTTLPETFTFGAAGTVCVREVPKIRITFQNLFPSLAGQTGTLTMRDINGNVVSVQPLVYNPGTTVDILYPGTSVNPDGSVADVPGWVLNSDGFWVLDPSDELLREGIFLTYEVNPTAGPVLVTYPPESSECANPNGPFPPPRLVPGELPPTE